MYFLACIRYILNPISLISGKMNTLAALTVLLLSGLVSSAPFSDDVVTVTTDFFPDSLAIYTSQYDIVNLFCPLNSLNFDEEADIQSLDGNNIHLFFVEADTVNGETEYKGLYVLKNKKATKLLENGRDFAATTDDSKKVFLAATDGIYVYNATTNVAEKYGTVADSLIGIAIVSESDHIYVLTKDSVLYKVSDEGKVKEEIPEVKDATQIVLDFENNLFYTDSKKQVYVRKEDGTITKIKGIPSNPTFSKLIRPPFAVEEGVIYVGGKKVYSLLPNGTSQFENVILKSKPSAFSLEATLLQYYAFEKKIYEYNILAIILGEIEFEEIKEQLENKTEDIKTMGTKSRKSFRPSKWFIKSSDLKK